MSMQQRTPKKLSSTRTNKQHQRHRQPYLPVHLLTIFTTTTRARVLELRLSPNIKNVTKKVWKNLVKPSKSRVPLTNSLTISFEKNVLFVYIQNTFPVDHQKNVQPLFVVLRVSFIHFYDASYDAIVTVDLSLRYDAASMHVWL